MVYTLIGISLVLLAALGVAALFLSGRGGRDDDHHPDGDEKD
jgi:nitrogen fixation-related uncharacterized protein